MLTATVDFQNVWKQVPLHLKTFSMLHNHPHFPSPVNCTTKHTSKIDFHSDWKWLTDGQLFITDGQQQWQWTLGTAEAAQLYWQLSFLLHTKTNPRAPCAAMLWLYLSFNLCVAHSAMWTYIMNALYYLLQIMLYKTSFDTKDETLLKLLCGVV